MHVVTVLHCVQKDHMKPMGLVNSMRLFYKVLKWRVGSKSSFWFQLRL